MAITLVSTLSSGNNSGSPTALAYSPNNTAGNLLIVKLVYQVLVSFSDSNGNTYQNVTFVSGATGFGQAIYYCLSAKPGANTVTGTGSFVMMTIEEYNVGAGFSWSGADGAAVTGDGNGNPTCGPIATTNPNDLILGAGLSFSSPTTPGAGFTSNGIIGITGVTDGMSEYKIVSATGSYTVNFSAASNTFSIIGVAIAAAAAPAPPATGGQFPLPVYKAIGIL